MAIINFSKRFIFVHVPKAAGTTVTNALSKYTTCQDLEIGGTHFGEKIQSVYKKRFGIGKHASASGIRELISTKDWEAMYKFSVVRNPYDRIISTYKFLKVWDGVPPEFKNKLDKFDSINEYVLSDIWEESDGPDYIFKPQTYWLTDVNNRSKVIVDYVARVENIANDLALIISKIEGKETKSIPLPHLNKTTGKLNLSDEAIAKINKVYDRDFKFWGYEKHHK